MKCQKCDGELVGTRWYCEGCKGTATVKVLDVLSEVLGKKVKEMEMSDKTNVEQWNNIWDSEDNFTEACERWVLLKLKTLDEYEDKEKEDLMDKKPDPKLIQAFYDKDNDNLTCKEFREKTKHLEDRSNQIEFEDELDGLPTLKANTDAIKLPPEPISELAYFAARAPECPKWYSESECMNRVVRWGWDYATAMIEAKPKGPLSAKELSEKSIKLFQESHGIEG